MFRVVQIALFYFVLTAGISIYVVFSEYDSIYEILQANGLPIGLFPKGVKEFNYDSETGRFSVYLNESCEAKYESELQYDKIITGTIGYAHIVNLSGISTQELFLWFRVKGIRVDVPSSGLIYFDVGVVRKQYSLSIFESPKDCVAVHRENKVPQSHMLPLYQVEQQTPGRHSV